MRQYLKQCLSTMWIAFVFIFMLVGCTGQPTNPEAKLTQPERVDYSFVFNARDMPDVEILDYWLRTERVDYTFNAHYHNSKIIQAAGTNGRFAKPTVLYVKWRIKSTHQEYQDTVDVRQRLPKDMAGSSFTFLIKDNQLNVYLATRELRPADWPIQGPSLHRINKVLLLYPDAVASPSTQQ